MSTKKQKNYDSHFQDEWLPDAKYNFWLKKYPQDSTKRYCLLCLKTVLVARKGKGNLDEHAKGQKHRDRVPCEMQLLITNNVSKIDVDLESSSATNQEKTATNPLNTLDKPTSPQSSMNSFYQRGSDSCRSKVVISCCIKEVISQFVQWYQKTFPKMFKDSKIAEKFTCGSTKCS